MSELEKKLDAIMRLVMAEGSDEVNAARNEIRQLMEAKSEDSPKADAEAEVRKILLELGMPDHLVGHQYIVRAVLLCLEDWEYINNMVFRLYPALAIEFSTTGSRAERGIRHAIEVAWNRGDLDILNRYFGNTVSADKSKPTNGEFIARITNVVKAHMKNVA